MTYEVHKQLLTESAFTAYFMISGPLVYYSCNSLADRAWQNDPIAEDSTQNLSGISIADLFSAIHYPLFACTFNLDLDHILFKTWYCTRTACGLTCR
jgi:hypothetical protein